MIITLKTRQETLLNWLENAKHYLLQQRHLDEGTTEQAYWNYGYLVALKDVLELLNSKAPKH